MIKKINGNSYGVIEYAVSFESEVEQLPTTVGQGSVCVVLENTNVYMFDETDKQWKLFVGGSSTGGSGMPGIDGREIELRKSETAIQWRYVGDEEWIDLVALDSLKGDKGEKGERGDTGVYVGSVETAPRDAYIVIDNSDVGIYSNELVEVEIVDSILNLTTDKYQKTQMENNTEIVLPAVDKYTEIHLFFNTTEELTLILPSVKWQTEPTLEANKTYEFIFTYANEWLGGCVVYA